MQPRIYLPLECKILFFSCDDADDKVVIASRDHGVSSDDIHKTEEVVLIARNFDEFRGESIVGKLLEANCGSPKIHNAKKIDENGVFSEIEVVELTEDHVDESNQRSQISEGDKEVEILNPAYDGSCNEIDESHKKGTDDEERKEWLEEDDWEGIESTELERLFGAAVLFVESKSNANRIANLGNDVKMQLYGFHKIATQGPCQKPQPMALNFSARAKWNAWQQLGIMSQELAMEQYITVLSNSIPDWMPENFIAINKSGGAEIQAFE
ncbi:acyl-CoA-binding domain-containing protein 3-like isoform X2 [Prosopis cineraria]|uniref:acyl-CoA-binding domain-containing protein 3-like isoform X2 n=1 Tax=Prosopis cineraria TaxID=364024 RepID=UPI00241030C2|nr:acyl-CoA-binding domain-containing protein 3-like isoform X2 [Prosopis cineraria]